MSEGEVVDEVENGDVTVVVYPDRHSEGEKEHEIQAKEYDDGKKEEILGVGDGASEVAEIDGDARDGSTDSGKDGRDISVEQIVGGYSRVRLAQAIKADQSLATARALADDLRELYYCNQGLLFRSRLDVMGDNNSQLCLPLHFRNRCWTLAHEKFGHSGHNKMWLQIKKFFYWPSMSADMSKHCRSCEMCQKHSKQSPNVMPMQEREIVTLPSERVCVDIVGPFPVAKGGFRFLLTCVDVATRWPETILLKKTTTKIVIDQLTLMFSRNGFPSTLVSDNGHQFTANSFKRFLKLKGIKHVKASPHHPQGNGVIERMHRTLNRIVAKSIEAKGNWAQMVSMVLYFLRCMPNRSSGLSPFVLKHV